MARKKKKADKPQPETLNRYGAQAIHNEAGDQCCCHMVPLFDSCDGCLALRETKRKPTLVGVSEIWVATPDDRVRGSHGPAVDAPSVSGVAQHPQSTGELAEGLRKNDDFAKQCAEFDENDGPEDV